MIQQWDAKALLVLPLLGYVQETSTRLLVYRYKDHPALPLYQARYFLAC